MDLEIQVRRTFQLFKIILIVAILQPKSRMRFVKKYLLSAKFSLIIIRNFLFKNV